MIALVAVWMWIEVERGRKWGVPLARSCGSLVEAWTGVKMSEMGKVGGYLRYVSEVELAGLRDGRWGAQA